MFTRRSLFKFLAAAPVAAAIEAAPAAAAQAAIIPPPLPKLAVPPPPSISSRFIVPQNPICDSDELLGRSAFRGAFPALYD